MGMLTPVSFIGGSLGPGELLLVFVVTLLLFGSKNVPKIARALGKAMEEFRRAAREVSDEIMRSDDKPPSQGPDNEKDTKNDKAG